jgi:hypothetical protein
MSDLRVSIAVLTTEVASGSPSRNPADKDQIADVVVNDAFTNRNFGHRAGFAAVLFEQD